MGAREDLYVIINHPDPSNQNMYGMTQLWSGGPLETLAEKMTALHPSTALWEASETMRRLLSKAYRWSSFHSYVFGLKVVATKAELHCCKAR